MSNPPLAQADLQKTQGTEVKTKTKDQQLIHFINQPSMKAQLAAALPRHMTPDRMIRIVTTEIRKTPALANCDMQSFIGAVVQCSQLGLEPGNALGHAYLL
ncbi:TPA: recombinase RecT, partial [Proteus mirabilis]|nr:recombinase RecT [Proteus mirabilis]HAU5558468.1 recombinase RecT [Proteus mirabilis]